MSILWVNDAHDGPIEGVAARGSEHYWFAARFDKATDDFEFPRRLYLYEMTDEEFPEAFAQHRRFEDTVGNLSDCFHLPPQERINSSVAKGRRWSDFYDDERNKRKPDYKTRAVVGWIAPPKRGTP